MSLWPSMTQHDPDLRNTVLAPRSPEPRASQREKLSWPAWPWKNWEFYFHGVYSNFTRAFVEVKHNLFVRRCPYDQAWPSMSLTFGHVFSSKKPGTTGFAERKAVMSGMTLKKLGIWFLKPVFKFHQSFHRGQTQSTLKTCPTCPSMSLSFGHVFSSKKPGTTGFAERKTVMSDMSEQKLGILILKPV